MPERDKVFFSYSHDDRKWLDELFLHLSPLVRERQLRLSWDGQIEPGQKWRQEIQGYLDSAKVAVLLVSPTFLASEFIYNVELPQILDAVEKEGVSLFWCLVRPCLYQESPIWEFQAAHNPEKAWSELSQPQRDRLLAAISGKLERAFRSDQPPPRQPAKEEYADERRRLPKEVPATELPRDELLRLVRQLGDAAATAGGSPAAVDGDPFRRARLILREVEDPQLIAEVGSLFVLKRDWPNALFAFERMVEIATPGNILAMALGYENLGFVYTRVEMSARARACWRLAGRLYRRSGKPAKADEVATRWQTSSAGRPA